MSKEANKIILDSVLLDAETNNRFSPGIKIDYKSKTYNYFGFSRDKGYIVISSAILEEGFVIGDIFKHSIPCDMNPYPIKKNLYYKNLEPGDVEDYYVIRHISRYHGFKCQCEVFDTGYVKVVIEIYHWDRSLQSENAEKLYDLGFSSFNEGDYPSDTKKVYVNDKILLSDDNLKIGCKKQHYKEKKTYPFDEMRCIKDENIDFIDLKSFYAELCVGIAF